MKNGLPFNPYKVSTHSRLKAAGHKGIKTNIGNYSFNTQPPEGGWIKIYASFGKSSVFQHTAA